MENKVYTKYKTAMKLLMEYGEELQEIFKLNADDVEEKVFNWVDEEDEKRWEEMVEKGQAIRIKM